MRSIVVRRQSPTQSPWAIGAMTAGSVVLAFLVAAILFLPFESNPLQAYVSVFDASLGSWRGLAITLNRAAPLILIALGTCVAWRAGFGFLGFEGCVTLGAAATAWFALSALDEGIAGSIPVVLFFIIAIFISFITGGIWAGGMGLLRSRFGGNEVLISLMSNYVAALFVQYLVAGPMRAPGSLPQTPRFPIETWLPNLIPGTRGHIAIVIAVVASGLVWMLMSRMRLGYDFIATGINPRAARYGGINVRQKYVLAAFFAGGLGAMAGLVEVLGTQHRLLDGLSGGIGFIGIIVALLAKLNPLAVVPAAILYAALSVGGDALQRSTGAPSSIIFILQSLIVLFVMASDILRYYRFRSPFVNSGLTHHA